MTDYQSKAYQAIPGYAQASDALARARRVMIPEPSITVAAVDAAAYQRLLAGNDLGDLAAELAAASTAETTWRMAQQSLNGIRQNLENTVANTRQTGNDIALKWLNKELHKVLAPLAGYRDLLAELPDAGTAIKQGGAAVQAWSAVQAAAEELTGIRRAQRAIALAANLGDSAATQNTGKNLHRFGVIRHAASHQPMLAEGDHPAVAINAEPWPADALQQILWSIREGVELWIPTSAELEEAVQEWATTIGQRRRNGGRRIERMSSAQMDRDIAIHAQNAALEASRQAQSRPMPVLR